MPKNNSKKNPSRTGRNQIIRDAIRKQGLARGRDRFELIVDEAVTHAAYPAKPDTLPETVQNDQRDTYGRTFTEMLNDEWNTFRNAMHSALDSDDQDAYREAFDTWKKAYRVLDGIIIQTKDMTAEDFDRLGIRNEQSENAHRITKERNYQTRNEVQRITGKKDGVFGGIAYNQIVF